MPGAAAAAAAIPVYDRKSGNLEVLHTRAKKNRVTQADRCLGMECITTGMHKNADIANPAACLAIYVCTGALRACRALHM